MKKTLIFGCFLSVLGAVPVHAELPDNVLDSDYRNCVGGDEDPARAAYCACIRDGMKNWEPSAYVEAAQGLSSDSNPDGLLSGKFGDLAKQCLSEALH